MSEHSDVLVWHPVGEYPTEGGDYLIYNQCDGFHIVEAWFDDGEFSGFWPFAGECEWDESCYCAWAKLPDTITTMFSRFGKPDQTDRYAPTEAGTQALRESKAGGE